MTELARERVQDVMAEIRPLLEAHGAEVGHWDIPLDIDFNRYLQADDADILRIYTARVDGELVGYAIYFLLFGTHFKSTRSAFEDGFYVMPERRDSGLWLQLLMYAERELTTDGAKLISQHQKVQFPQFATGLAALGYEHIDNVWGKRLG